MEHTDMIANTPTITVEALVDPVVEAHGYDPRSLYVEIAGIIGPTSLLLMRRLATGLEAHPNGFRLDATATAVGLGLGEGLGCNSPWVRTLRRLARFELCQLHGPGRLAVRRALAPLPLRQCHRLPLVLQRGPRPVARRCGGAPRRARRRRSPAGRELSMATTDTAMFCRFCGEELFERPDGTLDAVYKVRCDTTKCTARCDACLCLPHELAPDEDDLTELGARLEADAARALAWLWAHTDEWLDEPRSHEETS